MNLKPQRNYSISVTKWKTRGFLEQTDSGFKPTSEENGQFLVSGWLEKHLFIFTARAQEQRLKGEHFHSVQITRSNKKSGKRY